MELSRRPGTAELEAGPPPLAADSLSRVYGGAPVLRDVSLEVRPGEVLGVLGPNGAGKSTLFRLLLLLERPDSGSVLVDGRPAGPGDRSARALAGVFQRPHLFAGTALDNAAFGLRVRGLARGERLERAREALAWLGIAELADSPAGTLSGGEAQRVALARALVLEPRVLLLDEPTANLDVTVRRRFREDLERLVRLRAGAAVLITHDPEDAFALADRILVLDGGRIAQQGSPEELVLHPATPFVAEFTGAQLLLDGLVREIEEGLATVELAGGTRLLAHASPGSTLRVGAPAHVAYRPEDVVLSRVDAAETSARNRLRLRVAALAPAGGLVRVRLEGDLGLTAAVTRAAAESLGLQPGREVSVQLKATAMRAFGSSR